jgi:hypothetical protein
MASFVCPPTTSEDILKKVKASKEASVAGAFAGTGIPALDSIISGLSDTIGGLTSAGIQTAVTQMQEAAQEKLGAFASSALAGLVSILNLSAEAESVSFGMTLDSLKRQVALRLLSLNEILYHTDGALNILRRLSKPYIKSVNTQLKYAYPFIKKALEDLNVIQKSLSSEKPRFNTSLLRQVIYNIDVAIGIITGDRSRKLGQKFFNDILTKKKSVGQAFKDVILEGVVAEHIMLAEAYIWHLTQLAIITSGASILGVEIKGIDLTFGKSIPGVAKDRNTILIQRQQQYNTLKTQWSKDIPKENSFLQTLSWIDTNKGLVATHAVIKKQVELIKNWTLNWSTLKTSAKVLWYSLSPAKSIIEEVEASVAKHLKEVGDSAAAGTLTNAIAKPVLFKAWTVTKLEGAKQLLAQQTEAGEAFNAVASDFYIIEKIQTYLNSTAYQKYDEEAIDSLLKLSLVITGFAVTAPLNKAVLRRAVVLFTEVRALLLRAIAEDTYLLSLLKQLNILNNPLVSAVTKALSQLAQQSPFGAALVTGLVSGQTANLANTLSSVATAMIETASGAINNVNNLFKKITGDCNHANNKSGLTNAKVDEEAKIQGKQVEQTAKADENKPPDTAPWWEGTGDATSDFFMGLAL